MPDDHSHCQPWSAWSWLKLHHLTQTLLHSRRVGRSIRRTSSSGDHVIRRYPEDDAQVWRTTVYCFCPPPLPLNLPCHLEKTKCTATFKYLLKTLLFRSAYYSESHNAMSLCLTSRWRTKRYTVMLYYASVDELTCYDRADI